MDSNLIIQPHWLLATSANTMYGKKFNPTSMTAQWSEKREEYIFMYSKFSGNVTYSSVLDCSWQNCFTQQSESRYFVE